MATGQDSSSAICDSSHSWNTGSDSTVDFALVLFPVDKWHQVDIHLFIQNIKIPSVTSQTPDIPLNDCGSHYSFGCLVMWPFLDFRIPAAFVIGDVTGSNVGPLLSCTFGHGVWDAFGMYDGASRGPSILFNWVGDTLAHGPAGPPVSVFEAVLALDTEGLWASPTGVVLWVLPTEVVLWTPILWALPTEVVLVFRTLTAMSTWVPPSMNLSKVCSLCS